MTTFNDALALLRQKADATGLTHSLVAVSRESGITVFALEYLTAHLEEAIAEAMEPDERAEPGTMSTVDVVCFSCGAPCNSEADLCRGCREIVCFNCALTYDHFFRGDHGKQPDTIVEDDGMEGG